MKRFVALSQPRVDGCGLAEYRLTLDVEGRAVLEAALGPLSAPQPVDGERDLRSSDQRRGEALVALVRRAVASAESAPKEYQDAAVRHRRLRDPARRVARGRRDAGRRRVGHLLAPETVRRLACDAAIIPTVLGGAGEVVDFGRAVRLFTAAQTKRLWLRDGAARIRGAGCRRSGPTRITCCTGRTAARRPANAALFCERHHTIVHTRRYAGRLVQDEGRPRVEWDLRPGSYDELLAVPPPEEPA